MRIKELRIENNKTQSEVALSLGISRQVFANYEKEINYPDPKMLIKIADYFEVSIDYVVGRTNDFDVIQKDNDSSEREIEKELLSVFQKLDLNSKNKVIGYAFALLNL